MALNLNAIRLGGLVATKTAITADSTNSYITLMGGLVVKAADVPAGSKYVAQGGVHVGASDLA